MNVMPYSDTTRNNDLDEFLTPMELIEACFEQAILPTIKSIPHTILDMCANDGRWGKVARKHFPKATIVGIEIMSMPQPPEFNVWVVGDFLQQNFNMGFDLIVGNPAYSVKKESKVIYKAEDFVRHAYNNLTVEGRLFNLLRSNFRHSIERYWKDGKKRSQPGIHQTMTPYAIYDCVARPSFYKEDDRTKHFGTKNTNAHDYSLYHWNADYYDTYYRGSWIDWSYND
jgi:hypothetical protein